MFRLNICRLFVALVCFASVPSAIAQQYAPAPLATPPFARELPPQRERSIYEEQTLPQQPAVVPHADVAPDPALAPLEPPLTRRLPADQPPAIARVAGEEPLANGPPAVAEQDDDSAIANGVEWISAEAVEKVRYVWEFEITKVDDKPIRVGTVICGLVLFTVGLFSSKLIAWWFGGRFLPRLGMHNSAVPPVRSITYYVLLATFTMLSLRLVNVPLTAFTFLGGALAVGIGFGSQNLCNNFISGLILLAEQPIREGDSIQIDAFSGTVTKIGPRSTRITTGDNHEVIVPNSTFLQTNVVNRTLTDNRIRGKVKVGVAYGSPTRVVDRVLLQAAEEHEDVLDTPAPSVTFVEFGDNALQFELSFWVDCRSAKGPTESDIRYRIDELFRQEGVVMAYPQRDVHLNVGQPVEVRLAGSPLSLVREFNRNAA